MMHSVSIKKKPKSEMNNFQKIIAVNKRNIMICGSRDQCNIHWAMMVFDQTNWYKQFNETFNSTCWDVAS